MPRQSFREFLKGLELDASTTNAIMAEYGAQTTENLELIDQLKQEKKDLQKQIDEAPNAAELQSKIDELTGQVTSLTNEKNDLETSNKEAIKALKLDYALKAAIAKSNPIDEVAYRAHLDMGKISFDEEKDVLTGFEDQDKAIRESKAYLFQESQSEGQGHGGLSGGANKTYSIFDAVNEHYK